MFMKYISHINMQAFEEICDPDDKRAAQETVANGETRNNPIVVNEHIAR